MVARGTLPRFLVLEPTSVVRLEMELHHRACELDLELAQPGPGRSFVVMLGHHDGPFVQRARVARSAQLLFDPETPGRYVLVLSNPMSAPAVVRLAGREVGGSGRPRRPARLGPAPGRSPRRRGPAHSGRSARRGLNTVAGSHAADGPGKRAGRSAR